MKNELSILLFHYEISSCHAEFEVFLLSLMEDPSHCSPSVVSIVRLFFDCPDCKVSAQSINNSLLSLGVLWRLTCFHSSSDVADEFPGRFSDNGYLTGQINELFSMLCTQLLGVTM